MTAPSTEKGSAADPTAWAAFLPCRRCDGRGRAVIECQAEGDGMVRVTFRLPNVSAADRICVVGEFNAWCPTANPMERVGDDIVTQVLLARRPHLPLPLPARRRALGERLGGRQLRPQRVRRRRLRPRPHPVRLLQRRGLTADRCMSQPARPTGGRSGCGAHPRMFGAAMHGLSPCRVVDPAMRRSARRLTTRRTRPRSARRR